MSSGDDSSPQRMSRTIGGESCSVKEKKLNRDLSKTQKRGAKCWRTIVLRWSRLVKGGVVNSRPPKGSVRSGIKLKKVSVQKDSTAKCSGALYNSALPTSAKTKRNYRVVMGYPLLELTGKTAVVIGGTSGIGLALSKGLAQAGADVVPTGRRSEQVQAAVGIVEELGRRTLAQTCDVRDNASIETLLQTVLAKLGSVQILVNCAGWTKRMPTLDFPDVDWESIMDINLNGTMRACRVFARHMIERRYGRIINIASLSSFLGLYEVAAYCASKGAVASLTKALAVEWAQYGVCVNALVPGVLRTDLNAALLDGTERGKEFLLRTPMRRFGKLDELAGATIFLASDAASFVTGHLLAVDGGILASGVNQ